MSGIVPATSVATLVDGFDRSPAYAGLATALRAAIGDGRVPFGARLPSERELTAPLEVSRTTVTRAYALLVEQGYATTRRGAGTFAHLPGGQRRADRALTPRASGDRRADGSGDRGGLPDPDGLIDLVCAASTAPPGIDGAYAAAAADLPAYLGGHGYFPTALPRLATTLAERYSEQGLETSPEQIVVTSGALAATAAVAQTVFAPGDRAVVESPVYPNAVLALRHAGARIAAAPVDAQGWDLEAYDAVLRQGAPRAAYLICDFQNPTGHLLDDEERSRMAAALRRNHVRPIVDEAHRHLPLDIDTLPAPFATHAPEAITLGSASKMLWGGLRLGWVRWPDTATAALVQQRLGLDLGAPVFEQLVLDRLLREHAEVALAHRERLRRQRDHLVALLERLLPSWTFRVPRGGMVLWCELPEPSGLALAAAAEQEGVAISAGPQFAPAGGLGRFVRLPWVLSPEELTTGIERLARAWERVADGSVPSRPRSGPVLVV